MARPQKMRAPQSPTSPPTGWRGTLRLVLEWVWFLVCLLPMVLDAALRRWLPPAPKDLDGKVVLVTGAGRGLGKELAILFARLGAKVACVDVDREAALDTAAEIVSDGERARAYFTNVAVLEEVRTLEVEVSRDLGPVDILVNNAALRYHRPLGQTTEQAARAVIEVNFLGVVWMTQHFLQGMKARGSGHVVAVSSMTAHLPPGNSPLYTASKCAVTGLMDSLRIEVQREGYNDIHFTTVCPTLLDTQPFVSETLSTRQRWVCKDPRRMAARIIFAVRRNLPSVIFPEYLYFLCVISKLLPTSVTDWALTLSHGGVAPDSQTLLQRLEPIIQATTK